jgi:hypothetical protein
MRRTLVAVFAATCIAGGTLVSPAAASYAYKHWHSDTPTDWQGTRVTVDNPAGSEKNVNPREFFDTSAFAGDGTGNHLIQQGVTDEYEAGEGSCDLGIINSQLYYYVEIESGGGNYSCYSESTAATAEQHVQRVQKDSSGAWRSYFDGTYQSHQTTWTSCNGNACDLIAFAEFNQNADDPYAYWHAKFAGSGQTAWQQYNGTLWSTINNASNYITPNTLWSGPSGPFPQGIWSFIY